MCQSKETDALLRGYKKFHQKNFCSSSDFFKNLVSQGQNPKFLIVSCVDSRVDPALLFNAISGDLFVVRNVASIVPPYEEDEAYHGTSSALEFGIKFLKIPNLILLGHHPCGGIETLLKPHTFSTFQFLNKWMSLPLNGLAEEEKKKKIRMFDSHLENVLEVGRYSLINSLKNLYTYPWIRKRIQKKKISIHLWNFNMLDGSLEKYNDTTKLFENISLKANI